MVATILLKLLLFLAVFELASAIAGHRVYGTRFSLALPRITTAIGASADTKYIGSLVIVSEDLRTIVKIYYPTDPIKSRPKRTQVEKNLKQYEHIEVLIPIKYLLPKISGSGAGIYNTVTISSSSPIRVVLNRYNKDKDSADAHNVMPLESCSTSYFVTTGLGHAFLMVMTFDSTVNLRVTFPRTGKKFSFSCKAGKRCEDGSSVVLTLDKNKAWYVEHVRGFRFRNTLIETDRPVFVVAGNKALEITGRSLKDLVVTSIYPTEAWGKEYVIPRFAPLNSVKRNLVLQFNAKKLPFKFKFFDGAKYTNQVIYNYEYYYSIIDTLGFYLVTSHVPFGLYQIFGHEGQNNERTDCVATIINLILTEQWTNGVVLRKLRDVHRYVYKFLGSSTTNKGDFIFGTRKNEIIWETLSLKHKKRHYYFGQFVVKQKSATFFTKDPLSRLIVYQFGQSFDQRSCSALPMDFYQARINGNNSYHNKDMVPNDGVDNDYDGHVDEEIEDKIDNDGDGKIDEDIIETNERNVWSPWNIFCVFEHRLKESPLKVRACLRKRFAESCVGTHIACVNLPYVPFECGGKSFARTFCACPPGCNKKCQERKIVCDDCKAGFFNEQFCMRSCPRGWKGNGCAEWPLRQYRTIQWVPRDVYNETNSTVNDVLFDNSYLIEEDEEEDEYNGTDDGRFLEFFTTDSPPVTTVDSSKKKEKFNLLWILYGGLILLAIFVCVFVTCMACKRKTQPSQKETKKGVVGGDKGDTKIDEVASTSRVGGTTTSAVDTSSIASSTNVTSTVQSGL